MADDHWKAEDYASHASFVSQLSNEVMKDLSPRAGERILDLGCGDGELAESLLTLGCHVIGIDSSASFVEAARARGIEAILGDAQEIDFDSEFDAVFSKRRDALDATSVGIGRACIPRVETRWTIRGRIGRSGQHFTVADCNEHGTGRIRHRLCCP